MANQVGIPSIICREDGSPILHYCISELLCGGDGSCRPNSHTLMQQDEKLMQAASKCTEAMTNYGRLTSQVNGLMQGQSSDPQQRLLQEQTIQGCLVQLRTALKDVSSSTSCLQKETDYKHRHKYHKKAKEESLSREVIDKIRHNQRDLYNFAIRIHKSAMKLLRVTTGMILQSRSTQQYAEALVKCTPLHETSNDVQMAIFKEGATAADIEAALVKLRSLQSQLNEKHFDTLERLAKSACDATVDWNEQGKILTANSAQAELLLSQVQRKEKNEAILSVNETLTTSEDLFGQLCKASLTGEEKASLVEQLRQAHDRFPGQCALTEQRTGVDLTELRLVVKYNFENGAFFARTWEENREELAALRETDVGEYARKSQVFANKLLIEKGEDAAVRYTEDWMENPPPGLTAASVIGMANEFLKAHEKQYASDPLRATNVDRFHDALEAWRAVHSESQKRSEMESLELTRGYFYSISDRSLSLAAGECYNNCIALQPESPFWRTQKAAVLIDCGEWARATDLIQNLPVEYGQPLRRQLAITQYQVGSTAADGIGFLLSHVVIRRIWSNALPGSRSEQGCNLANWWIRALNNPIAKVHLFQYFRSDVAQHLPSDFTPTKAANFSFLIQLFTSTIVTPIYQRIAPRFVPNYDTRSAIGRAVDTSTRSIPTIAASVASLCWRHAGTPWGCSAVNLAINVVSHGSDALVQHGPEEMNPSLHTTVMAARSSAQVGGMAMTLYLSKGGLQTMIKHVVTRFGFSQPLAALGTIFNIPWGVAISTASVAYEIIIDLPRVRTAGVLKDIVGQCRKEQYHRANESLKASQGRYRFFSQGTINAYSRCIAVFERAARVTDNPVDKAWVESVALNINQALIELAKSSHYSEIHDDLLYHKIVLYLNTADYGTAKSLLRTLDKNSHIHGQIVQLVIEKMCLRAQIESASSDAYPIFQIPEYKNIVTKYQGYIVCRRSHPTVVEDPASPATLTKQGLIDELIDLVKPFPSLAALKESLALDSLLLHVNTNRTQEAAALLRFTPARVHEHLAKALIHQAEQFCDRKDYATATRCLDFGRSLKEYAHKKLLDAYHALIESRQNKPPLTADSTPEQIAGQIDPINAVIAATQIESIVSSMLVHKLHLYIQSERYGNADTLLGQHTVLLATGNSLLEHLIGRADNLMLSGQIALSLSKLHSAQELLTRLNRPLFNAYGDFLKLSNNDPSAVSSDTARIAAIEAALAATQIEAIIVRMRRHAMITHIRTQNYNAANTYLLQHPPSEATRSDVITHLVCEANRLAETGRTADAISYLQQTHKALTHFPDRDVIGHYCNFLTHQSQYQFPRHADALINALIQKTQALPGLERMLENVRLEKFKFHIRQCDFAAAGTVFLLHPDATPVLPANVQKLVIDMMLTSMHNYPPGEPERIAKPLGMENDPLIMQFCEILQRLRSLNPLDPKQINETLNSVATFLNALERASYVTPRWLVIQRASLLERLGTLQAERSELYLSLNTYSQAENLLEQYHFPEDMKLLNSIRQRKAYATMRLKRTPQ